MINVSPCKTIRGIGICQLDINVSWQSEILIGQAIGEINSQGVVFILKVNNAGRGNDLSVFFNLKFMGFRSNTDQEMIRFNECLAFFLRLHFQGIVILKLIRMPFLHEIPVNGLQFLQIGRFIDA